MNSISQCHELMNRKDAMEAEIKSLLQYLDEQGVGLTGSLTDEEDYPLANVDIYRVRETRLKLSGLKHDLIGIMSEIELKLHEIHATGLQQATDSSGENASALSPKDGSAAFLAKRPAFARVDQVAPDSVAAITGLQVGDEIVQVDHITKETFSGLQDVLDHVRSRANKTIIVCVKRAGKRVHLTMRAPIDGPIGCLLVPLR